MSRMIQTNPSLGKIIELVIKNSIAGCVLTKACLIAPQIKWKQENERFRAITVDRVSVWAGRKSNKMINDQNVFFLRAIIFQYLTTNQYDVSH